MSIDEAQALLNMCKDKFIGPTSHLPRSLLTKILTTWSSYPLLSLIVSGTGFRLQYCFDIVTSAILKFETDMSSNVIVEFGGYYDRPAMGDYIRSFFPIDENQLNNVFQLLQGLP